MAFSISNIIAFSTSFTLRTMRIRKMQVELPLHHLLRDYVAPTLASAALVYIAAQHVRFKLVHDVYITIVEILAAFLLTTLVYLVVTLVVSNRSRDIFRSVLRSIRQAAIAT